jgi:hypothetical protein
LAYTYTCSDFFLCFILLFSLPYFSWASHIYILRICFNFVQKCKIQVQLKGGFWESLSDEGCMRYNLHLDACVRVCERILMQH